MKKYLIFVAAAAIALVSCKKEEAPVIVPDTQEAEEMLLPDVQLSAVIDNAQTKTDYTISGDKAVFEWTEGDQIWRLVRKFTEENEVRTYSNYDHYTYYSSNLSGASATFTGSAVGATYDDTGFAMYPAGVFTHSTGTSNLTFGLPATSAYDAAAPLKNLVPMIGKLDGETYTFKPVVGVIGIRMTNIPADATSVSISSTSGGFSGNSVTMTGVTNDAYRTNINNLVGPDSNGLRNNWYTAGTSRTLTFSNLDPSQTYRFFFPAPTGTYTDLTITVMNGSSTLAVVNASGISLAISRAKITDIAAVIDLSKVKKFTLDDVVGTYYMYVTAGSYSSNSENGDLVLEASDDTTKGNIMITKFAGVSGKQYGTLDGQYIVFPKDQVFGANPYSNASEKPYVALDFYKGSVVDATFKVEERGKIRAVNADAMGLRSCTEADWANNYGGGWPWSLCFGSIYAERQVPGVNLVPLSESMLTPIATEPSEGSIAALVDNDPATYWHSPWSVAGTYDSTYGIYIDIDLGAGNGVKDFDLVFCLRNSLNDHPDHVKVYASQDGADWGSAVGELSGIYAAFGKAAWVTPIACSAASSSRYIRISILKSTGSNGNVSDLTVSGCTHMSEILLWRRD